MSRESIFRNSAQSSSTASQHTEEETHHHRTKRNPFQELWDSKFGPKIKEEKEMQEIQDSMRDTVKIISPYSDRQIVGDFDICREYSYEDEEHQDLPSMPMEEQVMKNPTSIYILGKAYHPVHDYASRRDFESSLFWFTYRSDFPEIAPYNITTDAGWGCMLRSAQMMLAHALRMHYKSRSWRPQTALSKRRQDPLYRSMLTWFADFPSAKESIYSLHNMVASGLAKYDKLPGEWYGPGTACYVLRDLVSMHEQHQGMESTNPAIKVFRVHVASQGTLYRDAIENLMTRKSKYRLEEEKRKKELSNPPAHPLDRDWEEELVDSVHVTWDTSLLLLIPLRLGLNNFNEDYVKAVAHTFSLPQSVGVLGGRPRGARWFYGALADGSKILGLDPHTIQSAPRRRPALVNGKPSSVVELSDDYMRSCHTAYAEVFSLEKMDPSIALGFYCRNQADLESLILAMKEWKEIHQGSPELFSVADASPNYNANASSAMNEMMLDNMTGSLLDIDDDQISDEDEYVML